MDNLIHAHWWGIREDISLLRLGHMYLQCMQQKHMRIEGVRYAVPILRSIGYIDNESWRYCSITSSNHKIV